MRFCFLTRGADPGVTEAALIRSIKAGMLRHGDDICHVQPGPTILDQGSSLPLPACDGALFFGIAMRTRRMMFPEGRSAPMIMLDKGYARGKMLRDGAPSYFRVSINDDQPLAYFQRVEHPSDRWEDLGIEPALYRPLNANFELLVDGASIKFCAWKELGYVELWGEHVLRKVRTVSDKLIAYRPRPDGHREPIVPAWLPGGARVDHGDYKKAVEDAMVVITHGGNMGFDAAVAGVPVFAMGNSIARPIAETEWLKVDRPRVPSDKERARWLADVAYCQWTLDEMESGEMWAYLKEEIAHL